MVYLATSIEIAEHNLNIFKIINRVNQGSEILINILKLLIVYIGLTYYFNNYRISRVVVEIWEGTFNSLLRNPMKFEKI